MPKVFKHWKDKADSLLPAEVDKALEKMEFSTHPEREEIINYLKERKIIAKQKLFDDFYNDLCAFAQDPVGISCREYGLTLAS